MRRQPYDATNPAIALACPACDEPGGQFCRRPSGDLAPWTHTARKIALLNLERTSL